MISLPRIRAFITNILRFLIPFIIVVFLLGFLTEWLTQEDGVFWADVALDMLPAMVVMGLALWLASRFVRIVFELDTIQEATNFLLYSRFGQPSFKPWKRIAQEEEPMGSEILDRIGGPGNLVVYNDSAVVLEQGGRLTRVVGAGFPPIRPFEKVYAVIDLRPKRYRYNVSAITKDGIPIDWEAEVRYQIDNDGQLPTVQRPYPYSEQAVLRAATCTWRREPGFRFGQDMDWEGLVVVSQTEGDLRTILARRALNQLIGFTDAEARAARESIQAELETQLRPDPADNWPGISRFGAKLLGVTLSNLQVKDAVTQQWIKDWKANWQSWSAGQLAQAEGAYINAYERAKAYAQAQFIIDITRGLQQQLALRNVTPQAVNRIILMRFFSMLDRADFYASSRTFFPTPIMELLEQMREGQQNDNNPIGQLPEGNNPE